MRKRRLYARQSIAQNLSTHSARLTLFAALGLACVACGARSTLDLGPLATGAVASPAPIPATDGGVTIPIADASPPPIDAAPVDASPACAAGCAPGDARCEAGGVSVCAKSADGCGAWGSPVPCAAGLTCVREGAEASCLDLAPARPIAPLSTATVTSQRPTFHWALATGTDGAAVEICRDRACATRVTTFAAHGASGESPIALSPGVYYWRLRGVAGEAVGVTPSVVWEVVVGDRSAPVNTSWGSVLDLDGDGFADLVVGAPDIDNLEGEFQVFRGSASGPSSTAVTFPDPGGNGPTSELGSIVTSAGDVNGDGFADLLVGANGAGASPGAAYVYFGGAQGLATTPIITPGPAGKLYFAYSASGAGDVNGDGYADVVLASAAAGSSPAETYVYLGSPSGLATTPIPLGGNAAGLASVAGAGDVNGDGFGDILVGDYDVTHATGVAYLYLGGAAGPSAPIAIGSPAGKYGFFAYSVAGAGDVNGDGFADVIVGAPGESPAAYVYEGNAGGLAASPIVLPNPAPQAITLSFPSPQFASSVASAGDVNGDGFADLVVGAPIVDSHAGAAYLYLGTANGPSPVPSTLSGAGEFGYALAGAGDLNGDGLGDLVIGAPNYELGIGAAYVYLGDAGGVSAAPIVFAGTASRGELGASAAIWASVAGPAYRSRLR